MTQPLLMTPALLFKSADAVSDQGVIAGYGSVFGGPPDAQGHIIAPGAFAKSLAQHRAEGGVPSMLWTHKPDRVIGKWTSLAEDHIGLKLEGRLNLKTNEGQQAFEHLKAGDVGGLSIGYFVKDGTLVDEGVAFTELDLIEISVVHSPANRRARVTQIKSVESRRDLEDALREIGLPKAAAKKLASGGWPALMGNEQSDDLHCTFCRKSQHQVPELFEWCERVFCVACVSELARKIEVINLPTKQIADALRASAAKWSTK